jgi:uracil-DNA glycosylase family 4
MRINTHSHACSKADFGRLNEEIVRCRCCARLVSWRRRIAKEKVARYKAWRYWGKGVPGFGDPDAQLLIVGLAPAAHGGNRTGRMFTGDRSGDWLYRALHKFGFANQQSSVSRDDGLRLLDCYITAVARCVPPANKLLRKEIENCRQYLIEELRLLRDLRVIIALGKVAFEAVIECLRSINVEAEQIHPVFAHGKCYRMSNGLILMVSFHPSQQNTFTGKLTEKMFHSVFRRAKVILNEKNIKQ